MIKRKVRLFNKQKAERPSVLKDTAIIFVVPKTTEEWVSAVIDIDPNNAGVTQLPFDHDKFSAFVDSLLLDTHTSSFQV